jgi:hypothetical protein
VLNCGLVYGTPYCSAAHESDAIFRVDTYVSVMSREINHESVGAWRRSGTGVTTTTNRDRERVLISMGDGRKYVGGKTRVDYELSGTLCIIGPASDGLPIFRMGRSYDLPEKPKNEVEDFWSMETAQVILTRVFPQASWE